MKISLLLLAIACIELAAAGTLVVDPNPVHQAPFLPQPVGWTVLPDPWACSYDVDFYLRQQFVYYLNYLTPAELCYTTYNIHRDGFLFIHQYRNTFGTFMSVCKYVLATKVINVISFDRIGDGYISRDNLFEPIRIRPFNIYFNLGYGVYSVPQWSKTQIPTWDSTWARQQFYKTPSAALAAQTRCARLDALARKTYWYYLDGAVILDSTDSDFGAHCYCMKYYVNRIGLWQVIGTDGPSGIEISTFVRLGDGYDPSSDGRCKPYPAFDSWNI